MAYFDINGTRFKPLMDPYAAEMYLYESGLHVSSLKREDNL